jgi:hypothetical protein
MVDITTKKSSTWLWALLLATVLLTTWTAMNNHSDETENQIELVKPTTSEGIKNLQNTATSIKLAPNESLITEAKLIPWDKLKRTEMRTSDAKDLFSPHSWVVIPPAPKIKLSPPPPPVAPPSPFTYFGKMEDGPKGTLLFLIANNKVYSVKKGDKIDAFWRFDSEDANNIYMTYLPLNLPQVLSKNQKTSKPLEANSTAEIN